MLALPRTPQVHTGVRRSKQTRRGPFNSTPMGVNSISLALRTYAPRGCIVRVVSQTKSRKIPDRKKITALFRDRLGWYVLTQSALDPHSRGNARTVTPTRCQRRRFEGRAQQGEAQRTNDGATETPPLPTQQAHSFFFGVGFAAVVFAGPRPGSSVLGIPLAFNLSHALAQLVWQDGLERMVACPSSCGP